MTVYFPGLVLRHVRTESTSRCRSVVAGYNPGLFLMPEVERLYICQHLARPAVA